MGLGGLGLSWLGFGFEGRMCWKHGCFCLEESLAFQSYLLCGVGKSPKLQKVLNICSDLFHTNQFLRTV
jgi:hypothetical protein